MSRTSHWTQLTAAAGSGHRRRVRSYYTVSVGGAADVKFPSTVAPQFRTKPHPWRFTCGVATAALGPNLTLEIFLKHTAKRSELMHFSCFWGQLFLTLVLILILYAFLPRDAMLARYLLSLVVCTSVRLSQAGNLPKRLNIVSRNTTPCNSPRNLVFWYQRSRRNSNSGTK